jgi:UDP-4-amino-4,6-dideoxy-N-acetyl-beta-L-altrosamine N-acetyltransferase
MIELRDLAPADADILYAWRRSPEVGRWMSDADFPSEADHRVWFDRLRADTDKRGWMITRDGRPSGLLTLTGLDGPHRRAEWNWFVGDADARGRGVGRAAQVLGLDRAFGELGLHKVFAEVMADNDAALKAQSGAGFRREGYLPEHVLKDGRPRDVVLLGMTAALWRSVGAQVRDPLIKARMISGDLGAS